MLLADARIRQISFVPLDQKHKCELLDSCSVYMFAEQMATILASNYHGMNISSMKDGFVHKLNIMVTSLKSVHQDAEKCIKVPRHCSFLQQDAMAELMSNPQLTPTIAASAILMGVGYKPRRNNIFVIKNIIGQYYSWPILLEILECILGKLH